MLDLTSTFFIIEDCGIRSVGEKVSDTTKTYHWKSSPERPFKDLQHHRIYYVKSGTAEIITSKGEVKLSAGKLYYFPGNTIIATRCESEMLHGFIHFSLNNPSDYIEHLAYSPCVEQSTILTEMFNAVIELSDPKDVASLFSRDGALRFLFGAFFKNISPIHPEIIRFNKVLCYIDDTLDKNISISELADMMNLSSVYFSFLFKKTFSISPLSYILQKKLILAKRLLLNSGLSIKEISACCGFREPYYFSNWFFKNVGQYPSAYKKTSTIPRLVQ